jgi:hypothetical protein
MKAPNTNALGKKNAGKPLFRGKIPNLLPTNHGLNGNWRGTRNRFASNIIMPQS